MKVRSDPEADAVYIRLDESAIEESSEVAPGVVLDYDREGRVIAIELLGVTARLPTARLRAIDVEIAAPAPPTDRPVRVAAASTSRVARELSCA